MVRKTSVSPCRFVVNSHFENDMLYSEAIGAAARAQGVTFNPLPQTCQTAAVAMGGTQDKDETDAGNLSTGHTRSVVWPSGSCELSAMVDLRRPGGRLRTTTQQQPHHTRLPVLVPHVVQQAHATHNTKNDRPGAADGAGVAHLATAGADYGAGGQPTCVYNVRKDF